MRLRAVARELYLGLQKYLRDQDSLSIFSRNSPCRNVFVDTDESYEVSGSIAAPSGQGIEISGAETGGVPVYAYMVYYSPEVNKLFYLNAPTQPPLP